MYNYEKLKNRRLELGLTLEEVGNYCGVGKSTVRKWENGIIKNMKRNQIAKLAEVLKVNPSFILDIEIDDSSLDRFGINKSEMIAYLEENNPELIAIYHHITEKENLSLLFDAVKDLEPEDLEPILQIVKNVRKARGLDD